MHFFRRIGENQAKLVHHQKMCRFVGCDICFTNKCKRNTLCYNLSPVQKNTEAKNTTLITRFHKTSAVLLLMSPTHAIMIWDKIPSCHKRDKYASLLSMSPDI